MNENNKHLENQWNKEDAEFCQSLNKSLEKLEQHFPVTTPDINWFEQKIAEQSKQIQKKWRQDLLLFSVIALVILSVMFTALFQKPVVFFSFQGLTLLFLIGYMSYEFGKKGEMRNHE